MKFNEQPSFRNALAKAKRNADIEKYSYMETLLDVVYEYYLSAEEAKELQKRFNDYCRKNYLYLNTFNSDYIPEITECM